jgi:D-alanine-D-alanine ligase
MAKKSLSIEIIRSTISELSSLGAVSAEGLRRELSKHYTSVILSTIDNYSDLKALVKRSPDLVFTGIKYVPKDNGSGVVWVTEYIESYGIDCTGSTAVSHEIELDKSLSKEKILKNGLPTSAFRVIPKDFKDINFKHSLVYPLFVKPLNKGGGVGIDSYSVVNNISELRSKVKSISEKYNSDSLVEEFLPGREFSVAILKDTDNSYLKMSLELIAPKDINGDRLLSEEVKSLDTETFCLVSDIALKQQIEDLALEVFHALGARDYGRIDIRLDSQGTPQFLEANLIPSLLQNYGNFPKACMINESISYSQMLQRIIDLTLDRSIANIQIPRLVAIPALQTVLIPNNRLIRQYDVSVKASK